MKDKRGLFMKMRLVAATVMGLTMSTTIAFAAATTTAAPAQPASAANAALPTDMDKLSYSIGADLGKNFKKQGIDISPAAMTKGLQDGINGGALLLTEDQMKEVLNKFQKDLMMKRSADLNKKAEDNKAIGDDFMTKNKANAGVVVLPSGLQYKVITKGTGAKPTKDDTVTVEYTGHLINGEVFDSTDKSGKPASFKVSQVIPGWTEVLQLMPAGSTWEVYVPANLAYGPRSVGGAIGPNETLIFTIKLLTVDKSAA